jgi:hypothetical protein
MAATRSEDMGWIRELWLQYVYTGACPIEIADRIDEVCALSIALQGAADGDPRWSHFDALCARIQVACARGDGDSAS